MNEKIIHAYEKPRVRPRAQPTFRHKDFAGSQQNDVMALRCKYLLYMAHSLQACKAYLMCLMSFESIMLNVLSIRNLNNCLAKL